MKFLFIDTFFKKITYIDDAINTIKRSQYHPLNFNYLQNKHKKLYEVI